MTAYQEDDWELDINFGARSISRQHGHIFRKNGVYPTEPEKELTLAYERYKYPHQHMYLEDDDTNSSVTSGSVMSSKFSEFDMALNDLDDFMFDEPPSSRRSSTLLWTPMTMDSDVGSLPGVVKKITVPPNYQEVQDSEDWTDDLDIPIKGITSLKSAPKCYEEQLASLDELQDFGELDSVYKKTHKTPTPTNNLTIHQETKINTTNSTSYSSTSRSRNFLRYEPEQDDDDMTGLDFPDNMAILPKRLDEKKKFPHNTSPTVQQPSKIKATTRIPVSSAMKSRSRFLSSVEREKDDDDFCVGLNIKEKAFTINSVSPAPRNMPAKSSALPLSTKTNILQQSRIKGKESTSFNSRLARPSPLLNSGSKQSNHALSLAKRTNTPQLTSNNKQKTSVTPRPTQPSSRIVTRQPRANVVEPGARNNNNSQYLTINKSLTSKSSISRMSDHQPAEKRSATGYTLIARPKNKVTSYCSRLDNIDNLNDLRPKVFPKRSVYTQLKNNVNNSNPEPTRYRSMQGSGILPDRSRLKLIQPNQQSLKKEYNDMTYDDSNHCWKGNETSLLGFQEKPAFRRPMLIMNKQQKNAPSRYAAVVGSSMIFNTESQKWVSANGQREECNELDTIEDLKDELSNSLPSKDTDNNLGFNVNQMNERVKDFKLTILSKRRMMAEQEQHESWIANWPIETSGF